MRLRYLAAAVAVAGLTLSGCGNAKEAQVELKTPAQKMSYGIGLSVGRNFKDEGVSDLNPAAIAAGVADALASKDQRLTDQELQEAFAFIEERTRERLNAVQDATAKAGQDYLAENAKREGVHTTESGLQYEIVQQAEGAQPKANDTVRVHYTGTLIDGTVFDSSVERGEPVEFPVGAVIPGWVEALQLMKVGEKYNLYVPSELAYGAQSPTPAIPANSVLLFEVELLSIVGQEDEASVVDTAVDEVAEAVSEITEAAAEVVEDTKEAAAEIVEDIKTDAAE